MTDIQPGEMSGSIMDRQKLDLTPGAFVSREGEVYRLTEVLDFDCVIGVDVKSGRVKPLRIGELRPVTEPGAQSSHSVDIEEIAEDDWRLAQTRHAAIRPLLVQGVGRAEVEIRSKEVGVAPATLYRWLRRYRSIGVLSALIPKQRGWKAGRSRIGEQTDAVIQEVIKQKYLTVQRPSPQMAIREVLRICKERGVPPPHPMTVRNRIKAIGEQQSLRSRGFREKANDKFTPTPGRFPNAEYPLAVVQIDHTPVDITLVDDVHRMPIGRPWITLAIDVYSRMVTGYFLSFDPPSETSVAMCVSQSVLPKDEWLTLHGVDARWDVWGLMTTIHTDNGAEFRSDTLKRACLMHDINLEFRPVKQPRYGGHIERLLGTLLTEIHDLPGTTFSNIKARAGYNSDKHAAFTKDEFEVWLVTLITKVYHQRLHKGIGMSPVKKWEIGMFGNAETQGRGLPPLPVDRFSLQLDFLPSFTRTIQTYGIDIEGRRYYADALRPWINAEDPSDSGKKRQFIFRRDPRDISVVWFRDPNLGEYFRVPFANLMLPAMSVWEHDLAKARVRADGASSVNDHLVMQGLAEMREKVEEAQTKTKKARRQSQRGREHRRGVTPAAPHSPASPPSTAPSSNRMKSHNFVDGPIEPYEDIR